MICFIKFVIIFSLGVVAGLFDKLILYNLVSIFNYNLTVSVDVIMWFGFYWYGLFVYLMWRVFGYKK